MRAKYNQGFTIVEVAVAVAVIAILVGLVTFSFNAAIDSARVSTLKADLIESSSSLRKEKADNGSYPQNQAQAIEFLSGSDGVEFSYDGDYTVRGTAAYCLEGAIEDIVYHITPDRTEPVEGGCL